LNLLLSYPKIDDLVTLKDIMIAIIPPVTIIRLRVLKMWKTGDRLPWLEYFRWIPAEKPILRALNIAKVTNHSLSSLKHKLENEGYFFLVI
jgi:hypothetical protein